MSLFGLIRRNYQLFNPSQPAKADGALKFGILGAAAIAYVSIVCLMTLAKSTDISIRPNALIIPAKSHPEVIIHAVAARDKKKAQAFAKKHGIPKVHESYAGKSSNSVHVRVYQLSVFSYPR